MPLVAEILVPLASWRNDCVVEVGSAKNDTLYTLASEVGWFI